jgi:hypothetical protein
MIEYGDADVAVAGGTESTVSPLGVGGFAAMRALSTRNDDPKTASRPWDKDRDGFVLGEGAGVMVLEEYEHAKARGAKIYAELSGFGMSADAGHMTAPSMDGPRRAMLHAMRNAGINADQVDYLNAHGTSTPLGDLNETNAIKAALGDHAYKTVVSSTKSMTGHLLGGAGGIESVFTVLALHHQKGTADDQYLQPGSRVRSGFLCQYGAGHEDRHRRQEQLWLWRHQRHAGLQADLIVLLWGMLFLWGAGGAGLWFWLLQGAGDSAARLSVALGVWLCAAGAVVHFWRQRLDGVLQWDGVRWHLEAGPTGDPAHPLKGALWVRLDLQSHLWVCLDEPGGRRTWLWLERQGAPERWGDLRRAVYSRPKPEATPADEPAAARRPPA